ncbi:lytic transglycosylase domain-containing protein [Ensifer sp. SL37]|uniref:lytic transglycosylase domain-containing protein n=1 Tax=Ensifer sp. SL37 TaxID=2995137 RepID=UPI0022728B33|nr:lytic transglycosylase domain-containing protein [Ensifer sp. SL37]MCY1740696.1 lytic transglycosylase domain-containing protein [Ensifer sp. SL37]
MSVFGSMLLAACFSTDRAQAGPTSEPVRCTDGAVAVETIKDILTREAVRQGVDVKLALAIVDHESGFGQQVNSRAGARGPMQLMPATAARYGVTDICDAAENIRGGVSYLKDLGKMFGGNIMLIVAAYNAGEGRVVAAGGVPAIAETVSYTALVTNTYYGFDTILNGGKRTRGQSKPDARTIGPGVNLLAETAKQQPDKPIPINQSKPRTGDPEWIAGSVLYVQ